MNNCEEDVVNKWNIQPSTMAMKFKNSMFDIVDRLNLKPNPEKSIIPLSIGDPCIFGNLKPAPEVTNVLVEKLHSGKFFGYSGSSGLQIGKEAVASHLSHDGINIKAENVFLCNGCCSAVDFAISLLADSTKNHNILMPKPCFPLYFTLAKGYGITPKYYNLLPENNWMIDLNHLEQQIDNNTAAIILNNPANPSGSVYGPEHLRDLLQIAKKHRLPIISDEIYENIIFPGKKFTSLASLTSEVPLLICGGLSKGFLIPGWRIGWIIIYDPLRVFDDNILDGLTNLYGKTAGINTPAQAALKDIFTKVPQNFHYEYTTTLYKNAKLLYTALKQIKGLQAYMPEGAIYMMVRIKMEYFPQFATTVDFLTKLMEEESVSCLPGECFQFPNFMRLVITPPAEILLEASQRISLFCNRYYKEIL